MTMRVRIADVVQAATTVFGLRLSQITGPSRFVEVVHARQAVMLVAREHGHAFMAIGRALRKDHTTVMHGAEAPLRARLARLLPVHVPEPSPSRPALDPLEIAAVRTACRTIEHFRAGEPLEGLIDKEAGF